MIRWQAIEGIAIMVQTAAVAEVAVTPTKSPGPAYLEAVGVSKRYGGSVSLQALDAISLTIGKGEFVSILGPSGCGKTTFLRCIAGIEKPSEGTITVGGQMVVRPPADMGMVFQRDVLLEWRTILDNLYLPIDFRHEARKGYKQRAEDLLNLFGLRGFERHFPTQLSGGMRQRVAICRALMTDPNLLLMDEPFGALDAMTRDQLNVELQRIWQATHKTVVFITHSIPEAVFLSDRVEVFSPRPGRIALSLVIDLPRPRRMAIRHLPEFNHYCRTIRELFEDMGLFQED
jgi:NitT/TauT family transport system ATP-binding protein